MATRKGETPIEAEIVEEKVGVQQNACCKQRQPKGSFLIGTVLLVLGLFLILENYLTIDLMRYFWPIVLLLLGTSLIYRSFNK